MLLGLPAQAFLGEQTVPPAPPPPIVIGTVGPLTGKFSTVFIPPAPPPPPLNEPPPPPDTIVVLICLVPGCKVKSPVDVLVDTVHFPNEASFVTPITPPFDEPDLFLGI
jgi:hypothetical protein